MSFGKNTSMIRFKCYECGKPFLACNEIWRTYFYICPHCESLLGVECDMHGNISITKYNDNKPKSSPQKQSFIEMIFKL